MEMRTPVVSVMCLMLTLLWPAMRAWKSRLMGMRTESSLAFSSAMFCLRVSNNAREIDFQPHPYLDFRSGLAGILQGSNNGDGLLGILSVRHLDGGRGSSLDVLQNLALLADDETVQFLGDSDLQRGLHDGQAG